MPSGYSPEEVQSKELKKSDVYLLILGAEYGHQEGISPTHKEYEEDHFEFDKDCILVYVKNDEDTVRKREKRLRKLLEKININCSNPKNPGQNSFPVLTQEFKR